jgi:outer membrane protein OmpA-like peptidoglycan-associated protein
MRRAKASFERFVESSPPAARREADIFYAELMGEPLPWREDAEGAAEAQEDEPCVAGVRWHHISALTVIAPFGFDQSGLTAALKAQVDPIMSVLIRFLSDGRDVQILRLVGHTDKTGPAFYNDALGMRRAQAVKTEIEGRIQASAGQLPARVATALRGVRIVTETRGSRDVDPFFGELNRNVVVSLSELVPC